MRNSDHGEGGSDGDVEKEQPSFYLKRECLQTTLTEEKTVASEVAWTAVRSNSSSFGEFI